jgi:hypothetical protein
MVRKHLAVVVATAAVALGVSGAVAGQAGEPASACHPVLFTPGSNNHQTKVCRDQIQLAPVKPPAGQERQFTGDGVTRPVTGVALFANQVPRRSSAQDVAVAKAALANRLTTLRLTPPAGCFGHSGIQGATSNGPLIAYECVYQPSGDGGALYWSANESNFNWDKHPGPGLLWVEASTLYLTPDANPPNTVKAFWVGIANNGTFCSVINPGYDQHPTQCAVNGTIQTMTPVQQASYNQFAKAMTDANVPDCAWSMTIVSDQCDIDP